jgi:hypothetical protein
LDHGRWALDYRRKQKGAAMSSQLEANESKEVYVQEVEIKVPDDRSLPAGQVIAEQSRDVKEHLTPRFVP